jgi:hypothetical protein
MWYNYQPPTPNIPGFYRVATAKSIAGPYSIIQRQVKTTAMAHGRCGHFPCRPLFFIRGYPPNLYGLQESEPSVAPARPQVNVSHALNGDFNLFQETDGTAYIVYNSDENGHLCRACHIPPCDCGFQMSRPGPPSWLDGLSVLHSTSGLKGAFVWVCGALNISPKWRFLAWAVERLADDYRSTVASTNTGWVQGC